MRLRNVVPRQGTETHHCQAVRITLSLEKCSSPTGDGNFEDEFITPEDILRNVVPRQGTET